MSAPRPVSRSARDPLIAAFVGGRETTSDALIRLGNSHPAYPVIADVRFAALTTIDRAACERALARAAAFPRKGLDPELAVLFLCEWTYCAYSVGRVEEAEALVRQTRDILSSASGRVAPELRALALDNEGFVMTPDEGLAGRERRLKEALGFLPRSSARHKEIVHHYALLLAEQGRLSEKPEVLKSIAPDGLIVTAADMATVRFVDAVEAGRIDEADAALGDLAAAGEVTDYYEGTIAGRVLLLDMARPVLRRGPPAPAGNGKRGVPLPPRASAVPPPWVVVTQALLARQSAKALHWIRLGESSDPRYASETGFDSLSFVRAELACGNADAARRLMGLRHAHGNRHYLDDLFLARIALLAGEKQAAAGHFARAVAAAERYGALGRLDFELALACEMTPLAIVDLWEAAGKAEGARRAPPATELPVADIAFPDGLRKILGADPATDRLRKTLAKIAPLDAPVLITGETGTGKELVAQAIHETSPRRDEPFVAINCGAIAESLLESELFGHERGAFTGAERTRKGLFEEAAEGTILLDEIGDISPRLQVALLRVLESAEVRPVGSSATRKIRCRVLAATNADLDALVGKKKFREDLLYRLRRLEVSIPPLRERRRDIPVLARHFLNLGRRREAPASMTPDLEKRLTAHAWPGNVRQLRNEMERMRLLHSDKTVYGPEDLALRTAEAAPSPDAPEPDHAGDGAPPGAPSRPPREHGAPDPEAVLREGRTEMRRLDRLRELFFQHKKLTRAEIARILAVSHPTATKDLKTLVRERLIVKVQPTPAPRTHYFVLRKA